MITGLGSVLITCTFVYFAEGRIRSEAQKAHWEIGKRISELDARLSNR